MQKDDKNRLPICMLVRICLGASVGLIIGAICDNVPLGLIGIPIGSGLGIVFDSIKKEMRA